MTITSELNQDQMAQQQRAKHLDRIRKLLAMGNDNAAGGEHERAIAMERAQKLMLKYNIKMSQIYTEFVREGDSIQVQADPWYRKVAQAASILFMTHMSFHLIPGTQKYKVTFVGQLANVETTIAMANYLINSIRKEGNKYRRENGNIARLETNFLNGCATALVDRVWQMVIESGVDGEVARLYETERAQNALRAVALNGQMRVVQLKTQMKMDTPEQRAAAVAGVKYGREVSLHKQVS